MVSGFATDSRDAREISSARGYENLTLLNEILSGPDEIGLASALSRTIGVRSSTSKTRSNETSAVITSTRTLESAVSGPYNRASKAVMANKVPKVISLLMVRCPPTP